MPYTLTAMDVKTLRAADRISVRLDARAPEGSVVAYKANPLYGKEPFAQREHEHSLSIPVKEHKKAGANYAGITLYRGAGYNHAESAIDALKVGDEVSFFFYADAGTNQYCGRAGIHVDFLYLYAVRGKRRFEFIVDISSGPDNSARMCRGVPFTESMLGWSA